MDYRSLVHSGLKVSPMCLGTMMFGGQTDSKTAQKIVSIARDSGVNFIDTADTYNRGESERIVGKSIAEDRDKWVLATKAGNPMGSGPNEGGLGRKWLLQAIDGSLERLGTDHVDLYWVHAWDFFTPIDEIMRGLDDLVRAGKVLYVGISDAPAWRVSQANTLADLKGWSPFVALQIKYSLIDRTAERDLLPMAKALDLAVTPWGMLESGLLSGKYLGGAYPEGARFSQYREGDARTSTMTRRFVNERTLATTARVIEIAEKCGVSPVTFAVAWTLTQPFVASSIIGVTSLAQLDEHLAAADFEIPAEALAEVEALSKEIRHPME